MAAVESELQKVQQEPSQALPNVVESNGAKNIPYHEPRLSESEWVVSIKEKLEQACKDEVARLFRDLSIYKFPRCLKNGGDKAWVPQIVSLGPYHHGKKHLREMDQHKRRCLRGILHRTGHEIGLYLNSVKEVEKRARACYEGQITMSSNKFVEMMVFNGCFVIELFRGYSKGFDKLGYSHLDPVFSTWKSVHKIQQDMLMLENQIPLFILDQLHRLQLSDTDLNESIVDLAIQFFNPLMPMDNSITELAVQLMPMDNSSTQLSGNELWLDRLSGNHCLDMFRWSLLHSNAGPANTRMWSQGRQQLIHCVTELRRDGIKFSKRKTDRFWDIQFKDGTLEIPRLVVNDGTRSLFLNLIAFEQCHFYCNSVITSYVIFMDNLINSPEDVKYLCNCQIIEHWLGSNTDVAELFNGLSQDVAFDINDSYLYELSKEVHNYYRPQWTQWGAFLKHRWNKWKFVLKEKYFTNPWSIISLIAAFILLALTFAQTFYTPGS